MFDAKSARRRPGDRFTVDVESKVGALVTVRWYTPPPNSIDERLIVTDDGRARLEVLKPRSLGDTVGDLRGCSRGV